MSGDAPLFPPYASTKRTGITVIIYIYIHMCVCVCVELLQGIQKSPRSFLLAKYKHKVSANYLTFQEQVLGRI